MMREPMLKKMVCINDGISSCVDCIEITDFKTNEIICQKCGLVLQDNVSQDNKINNEFSKRILALM